jgi:hypothetical protein
MTNVIVNSKPLVDRREDLPSINDLAPRSLGASSLEFRNVSFCYGTGAGDTFLKVIDTMKIILYTIILILNIYIYIILY